MKFSVLSRYFERIEKTPSRLEMTRILAEFFKEIDSAHIDKVLYLMQGRVVPLYEKSDFGMAQKMLVRAIVQALNIERKAFMSQYKRLGDLGLAVEHFRKDVKTIEERDLSIDQVFTTLKRVADASGAGSQDVKLSLVSQLIRQLDPLSCRFIVRIPIQTLRLGFSDMTILDAFSWMIAGDKSLRSQIEQAYLVRPDLGFIGKTLKTKGMRGLKDVSPQIFIPILMMKAERLSDPEEILKKGDGKTFVESKYDGFRLQVHVKLKNEKGKRKNEVRLYSRNLDDVTYMYPDIVEGLKKQLKVREIIFEGEAIGFNPQTGDFLPFQETVQRKRKYGIHEKAKEIPLKFFAFDALYVDGKSLLNRPFRKRRTALEQSIKAGKKKSQGVVFLARDTLVDKPHDIELLFDEAVARGLEGIVAKRPDGVYQPGARAWNWIKYKRSYASKIEDTLDCLVMGYDVGKGKRARFGIGAFLVGVYDKDADQFLTVAKIGTGLTDGEWRELKTRCTKIRSAKKPALYNVDKQMSVDVWTKPQIVVEIRADEITRSPVHTAGRTLKKTKTGKALKVEEPGYALRFPRLERFRDDKRPDETTVLDEVQKMYKQQKT